MAIKSFDLPEGWADKSAKRSQKYTVARWTKKHGTSHYCYKNPLIVDRKHQLVRRYHVSDAALHYSQVMGHLLMWGNTGCACGPKRPTVPSKMEAKLR